MVCPGEIVIIGLFLFSLPRNKVTSVLTENITVAGFFQIYKPVNEGCSKDVSISSIQYLEAVKWTFQKLNMDNFIPGINIDLSIYPTCRTKDVASEATFNMLNENCVNENGSNVFAAIGPEFSEQAAVISGILSSLPSNKRLCQMGFSTTVSDLVDSSLRPNLFRVIPDDSHQIQAMIALMKKINWNYIAIIYEDDKYGRHFALSLKSLAHEESICVPLISALPVSDSGAVVLRKLQLIIENITISQISGLIYIGASDKARILLTTIDNVGASIAGVPSIIFSEGIGLSNDVFYNGHEVRDSGKGAFIFSPAKRDTPDLLIHWRKIFTDTDYLLEEASTNRWLLDVFENINDCRPSADSTCAGMTSNEVDSMLPVSVYTSYAIEAAFVIAKGIQTTIERTCERKNVCRAGEVIETMKNLSISFRDSFLNASFGDHTTRFDENNEIMIQNIFPIYDIYNFRDSDLGFDFRKVGEWKNKTLEMDLLAIRGYSSDSKELKWPNIQKAQCPQRRICSECLMSDNPYVMYYIPGDVVFVGFMPVFDKSDDPLICAGIRKDFGLEVVQGLVYITEKANEREGIFENIFRNMKIGLVIINSCNNALVAEEALITLFRDGIHLPNGSYVRINSQIIGFIGEQGSTVSKAGYNVISRMEYVQVSYASTLPSLSDREVFPLFMRVTPSDEKQGNAIIDLAKKLNFTYIQIIHSVGRYGEGGRDAILQAASVKKVCVAQVIALEEFRDYDKILNELRKQWHAKLVVIYLRSHIVGDVMEKITDQLKDFEFTFIGSEAWGSNQNNLRESTKLAGSLTIGLDMVQHSDFNTYLHSLSPSRYPENPWLQTYMQVSLNCYYADSFNKSAERECTDDDKLASGQDFEQDIWTPFGMNTLTAFLLAANKTFTELCGNIQFICPDFHSNPNALIENMKLIKLDTQKTGQYKRIFDDNGDGVMDYKIYNIQQSESDSTKLVYKHVGDVPFGKAVELRYNELKLIKDFESVCPNDRVCSECFPNDVSKPDEESGIDKDKLALGILLGVSLLSFITLLGIFCYCLRRLRTKLNVAKDYITPMSVPERNLRNPVLHYDTPEY